MQPDLKPQRSLDLIKVKKLENSISDAKLFKELENEILELENEKLQLENENLKNSITSLKQQVLDDNILIEDKIKVCQEIESSKLKEIDSKNTVVILEKDMLENEQSEVNNSNHFQDGSNLLEIYARKIIDMQKELDLNAESLDMTKEVIEKQQLQIAYCELKHKHIHRCNFENKGGNKCEKIFYSFQEFQKHKKQVPGNFSKPL